ncbi:tetratricopeptide repeat protein [Chitinophaga niabensis]|uniref:Tetratricopeptide repeat-containing protein n=1 Tax=Chitinophaga niabensis TaxID=536979 RepID=A0A1N6JWJ1_9BACT|nr:tetratricopeptide repeat protein [Chitinophaga niabensis]SIO48601.1 Tetratricopeptide repeat-containing protein [Chitinophaga niabensis]
MLKRILSLCMMMAATLVASAQSTNRDLAQEKMKKAIELMDNGQIEPSIALLEEAIKLDPDEPTYTYEIGYAKYLGKDYKAAIKIMKDMIKKKNGFPGVYQLLGNSYDLTGDPEKAIDTYEKGLKEFPNAGNLYLEMGVMQMSAKKDNNKAIQYFEAGVKAAPKHSSNYYWLGKLFCNSDSQVWGMLYGEIFMNIERGSKRTEEMSKLLYLTYKSGIQFNDTGMLVRFSHHNIILLDPKAMEKDPALLMKKLMPYGTKVYELELTLAAAAEKHIDLASLHRIRENFLEGYYKNGHALKYPNLLFDYQLKVKQNGHLEAYNYWLLSRGDGEEFANWKAANEGKWGDFIRWFQQNPMEVSGENVFFRGQYL